MLTFEMLKKFPRLANIAGVTDYPSCEISRGIKLPVLRNQPGLQITRLAKSAGVLNYPSCEKTGVGECPSCLRFLLMTTLNMLLDSLRSLEEYCSSEVENQLNWIAIYEYNKYLFYMNI